MAAEGHGVWASGGDKRCWVDLKEVGGKHIQLSYPDFKTPLLTPEQARFLAGWLAYMADHLEGKLDA